MLWGRDPTGAWIPVAVDATGQVKTVGGGGGGGVVQQGARDVTAQAWFAGGDVADGAADSGNPVKVGGVVRAAPRALVVGQRADLLLTGSGLLGTAIVDNASGSVLTVDASGRVDIGDRVARELGRVTPKANAQADSLFVRITNFGTTNTADVNAAGQLSARLDSGVDVTDRAARAVGQVSPAAASVWDVSDRAAREAGRVRIWDGVDEATVLPVRTQLAATEKALIVFELPYRQPTYATTTIAIAPAITVGVKELLAIWHAAAGTKDIYIVEIWVSGVVTTAGTAGRSALRVSTITTAPTGGTEEAKVDVSGSGVSDMTNTMRVKTGGGAIGSTFIRKEAWSTSQAVNSRISESLFIASNPGNGLILRAGVAAGLSVDIEREVAHTALVDQWTVGVRWLEV
jgi:hypothetical protein